MITTITLVNFQRHHRLTIDLSRVLTITGDTDKGKSSILRALRWVTLNQFPGPANELVRWNKKAAKVTLKFGKHTVTRKKGKGVNTYSLDGKVYKAFGAGKVPDPIADVLKLTEANFQMQLDPHMWFSQSAGEVSRQLNQIINLNQIDDSLSYLASELRKAKTEVELTRKRSKAAWEQVKELSWVKQAHVKLGKIEKLQAGIVEKGSSLLSLGLLLLRAVELGGAIRIASNALLGGLNTIRAGEACHKLAGRANSLSEQLARIGRTEELARTEIPTLPDPTKCSELQEQVKRLSNLLGSIEEKESKICVLRNELAEARKNLKTCPTCGRPL